MKEYGIINAYHIDLSPGTPVLPSDYGTRHASLECVDWYPSPWSVIPSSLLSHAWRHTSMIGLRHLVYWWLHFYFGSRRQRRYYSIRIVREPRRRVVHFAVTRSQDFRFPFMKHDDLQVGPVWSAPTYRSSGLATESLVSILSNVASKGWRRVWWLCRDDNVASNRIPVRARFTEAGKCVRTPSIVLNACGVYRLSERPTYGMVTELPGHGATADQNAMRSVRYGLAARWAPGKEVLEVACGSGMGLGLLAHRAKRAVGGDIDEENCRIAAHTYRCSPSVKVTCFAAEALPFSDSSFDVVCLFEAIYYLRNCNSFLSEVRRVLRPGGMLVLSTVNCSWRGFNPSPLSTRYYDAADLRIVLARHGFKAELLAGFPDVGGGLKSMVRNSLRTFAIRMNIIPKTMRGKEWLKRLFYGGLTPMGPTLQEDTMSPVDLLTVDQSTDMTAHRMLYAVASVD